VYALNARPDLIVPQLVLLLPLERVLLEHIRQPVLPLVWPVLLEHIRALGRRLVPCVRLEPFHQRPALVYALNVLPDLIVQLPVLQLPRERALQEPIREQEHQHVPRVR